MKQLLCITFVLLIVGPAGLFASRQLEIKQYDDIIQFNDKRVVYLKKGDDPEYSKREYDDHNWKRISLPSLWQKYYPGYTGICWYRIHIRFPSELPDHSMGVCLGTISDVDQVFFNGSLIGQSGKFAPERVSAYDKKRIYDIPVRLIRPGEDNLLAVRVGGLFKQEAGPYKGTFAIGPYIELLKDYYLDELFDAVFIFIYIIISLYFLFYYVSRYIDREYLFFALFTLQSAVYLFLRTDLKYLLTDDFLFLKRIEYIILFTILLTMMEYITCFFKRKNGPVHYVYIAITGITIVPVAVTSDPDFWYKVLSYVVEPAWAIPMSYSIYTSVKHVKKQEYGKYILLSFPLLWISFLNDVLVSNTVIDSVLIVQYVFIVVIIGTGLIMKKRYLNLFKEVAGFKARSRWKPVVTAESKKKIEEVIKYLEDNYTYDISREGIAETLHIHHDYLGKLFKQYKGMKIGDYINVLRIEKATQLLIEEKERSVTDIAFDVGYESLSTFYRVFQNIMKESPTDFRSRKSAGTG